MPNQGDDGSKISTRVETNKKSALEKYAYALGGPHDTVYVSDLVREAIDEYLGRAAAADELPPEALDDLDDDLLANAGGEENGENGGASA